MPPSQPRMETKPPAPVKIGTHTIDATSSPFIIAEVGVNHNGQVTIARQLIDAAHQAGVHAVKFQVFSADTLVSTEAPSASYQTAAGCDSSQYAMLKGLELQPKDFAQLADYCRSLGLSFLATPFGVQDVQTVVDLGAPALKIASTDLNDVPILEAALASRLPLIVSTGASELSEIDEATALFREHGAAQRLVLLHCVSSYPTAISEAALSTIRLLRDRYRVWTGFSDHTEIVESGGLAVAAGAKVLEKHITLDRSWPGPDQAFSLTPDMLKRYVESAQMGWQMLGTPREGVAESEKEVRQVSRKSVVARVTIRKGERITAEHLAIKRPGGGIEPKDWLSLVGKVAQRDISRDAQIGWDMVNG